MKKIISMAVLSSLLISCSKEMKNTVSSKPIQNKTTDTAAVAGILLELIDHDGKGQLKIDSDQYKNSGTIKIKPPCYFLRRDGKVLSFSYPDVQVDQTLIIQGENGVQGILFKKDSIIYEDYIPTSTPYNIKEGADEILYQDFAHRFYKNKY